jgi:DNA-binding XRE family transcriptional regulator
MAGFQQVLEHAIAVAPLPALAEDVKAVSHKARYPMAEILAKVPGDTLTERARAIGVSRQTMYVWAAEQFRPSPPQAAIISELTGVPVYEITDYREGEDDRFGKPDRTKAPRLAKAGKNVPRGSTRLPATKRGVAAQQGKRRHDRKAGK